MTAVAGTVTAPSAPINEIVGLLDTFDRASLQAMEGTVAPHLLKPGLMQGGSPPALTDEAKIALKGLAVAQDVCARCIPLMLARIKRSKALLLSSQLVGALAGLSLLGTLAGKVVAVNYGLAALTLLASVSGIVATFMLGSLNPNVPDLAKGYGDIVDDRFLAAQYQARLEVLNATAPPDLAQIADIVTKSNDLCREINVLASAVGVV